MNILHRLKTTSALISLSMMGTLATSVHAQQADTDQGGNQVIDEIVITGSYIKRKSQADSPAPLNILGGSDLSAQGLNTVGDIARNMTFAAGSEVNTDAFTQNFSTGTANVNLRGLGLSSTLILLNGKRQTLAAAYADDGSTFVDTNSLVPMIMIDRVETLKDGGSALYGSDAVSGVVNYITRKDFTGIELDGRFQTTTADSQRDYNISGIFGTEVGENGNFVVAASYMNRERLSALDRAEITDGSGISGSGQPGTFFIPVSPTNPAFGALAGKPLIDPACSGATNSIADVLAPGAALGIPLDVGLCRFQFDSYYDLVPEEQRFQAFASFDMDFGDTTEFYMEAGYANNKAQRSNAPAFPIASVIGIPLFNAATGDMFPHVPAELAGLVTTINTVNAGIGQPAVTGIGYLGRVLGGNGEPLITDHNNETFRIAATLDGEISESWGWHAAANYSESTFFLTVEDVLRDAYLNALATGAYNPFGTNLTTHPNSQAVLDSLIAELTVTGETSLFTAEAYLSGDLVEMGDNMIAGAFGVQYRKSTMSYDWSDDYNGPNGDGTNDSNLLGLNGGNLMFLFGGPDFKGDRDVYALFGELAVPLGDTAEVQLAARYEDYGNGINSFDPKISALWRPTDSLSLRGSFSTSFRAASLFNTVGVQTSLNEIALGASSTFIPVRSTGDQNLVPEEANIYNFGVTWQPIDNFTFGIDYWRYEFTNLITQENSQSVVNRALAGDTSALSQLHLSTPGDFSTLFLIETSIINAPTVTTDGLDITATYDMDLANGGNLRIGGDATYIFKYEAIDQAGTKFDGAGSRNFNNFARSMPEWRANFNLGYSNDHHAANIFVRYIDGYLDDQNNEDVPSYTTVDLQYSYLLGDPEGMGTRLSVGVINVFDKDIPKLNTNAGFDVKVHDPRQRMAYINVTQTF